METAGECSNRPTPRTRRLPARPLDGEMASGGEDRDATKDQR